MNRIKEQMMAGLLASTILAGAILAGGTQLTYEGKTIFESEAKVSFGATYGDRAVKAVVNAKEEGKISVRTDKKPVRVFVNRELLDAGKWNYLDDKKMTTLVVPAGSTSVQFRFDDMATLKPMALVYKVAVDPSANGGKLSLDLKGVNVDEKFSGQVAWPENAAGLYEVTVSENSLLKPVNASRVDDKTYFLTKGSALQVDADAPGGKAPDVKVTAKCVGNAVSVKSQNREKLLARKDIIKVEGEAFDRMIGGEVSISKEHKNTSAGGCIFAWGTAGTRLEWDVKVPGGKILCRVRDGRPGDCLIAQVRGERQVRGGGRVDRVRRDGRLGPQQSEGMAGLRGGRRERQACDGRIQGWRQHAGS